MALNYLEQYQKDQKDLEDVKKFKDVLSNTKGPFSSGMKSIAELMGQRIPIAEELINTNAKKGYEKRRIEEKQIRMMRNNTRAVGGFLSNNANVAPSPNNLGSAPGLPTKLGSV